jgi:hypothetical protein
MNLRELAELRYETGYVFENGTVFYETLGDERAAGLLKALQVNGYRIARSGHRQGRGLAIEPEGSSTNLLAKSGPLGTPLGGLPRNP